MCANLSKSAPQLHSVASSLRSCLDGMLPDSLRNDPSSLQRHLEAQKPRLQQEKNSWRFGLNYLFETLKQHKEWYGRNQQFVQLNKDIKRLEAHVSSIRALLSDTVSKLDLEAGLRVAESEKRVGAYRFLFEITRIASKLSRPLVKLQILKPSESSISIYCDTFVLDIVLSGGDGALESASITTVEKDQCKQYPERDEDLLQSLQLLANGDSSNFTEKVGRLIDRAELAVKYPDKNFEQLEEDVFVKLCGICKEKKCWSIKRVVDGILVQFKDPHHCPAVFETARKRAKIENDPSSPCNADTSNKPHDAASMDSLRPELDNEMDTIASAVESCDTAASSPKNPLVHGEWTGIVSFIEWNDSVSLHVVGYTPLVMVGIQARRLAAAAMTNTLIDEALEEDNEFNGFLNWTRSDGKKTVIPRLYFSHNFSHCFVSPPSKDAMLQEYLLITKEISGGYQIESFPIPLTNTSEESLRNIFQILTHSLFFHSVILSVFGSSNNLFGRRISLHEESSVRVSLQVSVQAPEQIVLKTKDLYHNTDKQLLIEIQLRSNMTLNVQLKFQTENSLTHEISSISETLQRETDTNQLQHMKEYMDRLSSQCHSVPLLTYYALMQLKQCKLDQTMSSELLPGTDACSNEELQEALLTVPIESFQDMELQAAIKLEGEKNESMDEMLY